MFLFDMIGETFSEFCSLVMAFLPAQACSRLLPSEGHFGGSIGMRSLITNVYDSAVFYNSK